MTLASEHLLSAELPVVPRIRLRLYLLATYVLFIVYVSLSPFSNWQDMGLSFIDAPVSGGQAGAENGVLTIMCGGDVTAFDRMLRVGSADQS